MRLTVRGGGLLASAVVMALAAALFGIEELWAVAVGAAALVAAAVWWARRYRWDMVASRRLAPDRVPAGSDAVVTLAVRNHTGHRSPIVALRDPFDGGRSSVSLAVAPLEPGATARTTYRLPAPARGVFGVGPLEIELADPFGLVTVTRTSDEVSTLVVHPRIIEIPNPTRSFGTEHDDGEAWAVARSTGELATVREYRTGDELRRVHWPSTARLDELMVRQDESPVEGHLSVVLDLRAEAWTDGGLEVALSIAASIAVSALNQRSDVRLVTSSSTSEFGDRPSHRGLILDTLASATATDGGPQAYQRLIEGCRQGPAVLITSAGPAGRALAAASPARARSRPAAILVLPHGAAGVERIGGDRMVQVVDRVEALLPAWRSGQHIGRVAP